jgi:hypothetical protein
MRLLLATLVLAVVLAAPARAQTTPAPEVITFAGTTGTPITQGATARDATFVTTDRCDGTVTEVGKGRVTLAIKGKQQPVVVGAGGAYLAKAKLFAARKGKRPIT